MDQLESLFLKEILGKHRHLENSLPNRWVTKTNTLNKSKYFGNCFFTEAQMRFHLLTDFWNCWHVFHLLNRIHFLRTKKRTHFGSGNDYVKTNNSINTSSESKMTHLNQYIRHSNLLWLDLFFQFLSVLFFHTTNILHRKVLPIVNSCNHLSFHLTNHEMLNQLSPIHKTLLIVHQILSNCLQTKVTKIDVKQPVMTRNWINICYYILNNKHTPGFIPSRCQRRTRNEITMEFGEVL